MPQDTQWKSVAEAPDGRRIGWDGDPNHGWVPIPSTGTDRLAMDVTKGAGFDPQKVFEASETPATPGRSRLGNMGDELLRESASGFGHWVLNTLKDPAHLIDPLNAAASGIAGRFDKSILRPLLEAQKFGLKPPNVGEELGSLAAVEMGADTSTLGGRTAKSVARMPARAIFGVGKAAEHAALENFTREAGEARKQYQADLKTARTKNAGNRAAAMDDARKAEEAYQSRVDASRKSYQDAISERKQASAQESAAEAKKGVTGTVKSGSVFQRLSSMADSVATNAAKARDAARAAFNKQWDQLRTMVGKDAQTNWTPVQQAVLDARKNMLAGSPESLKIFNNILNEGGAEDFIDTEAGATPAVVSSTQIPYRDAQGYYTELGTKMYGGAELPGDVWRAINHVREAIGDQMAENHRAVGAEQFAKGLRSSWSKFMDDFYNPDSPTRKLIDQQQSQGRIQQLASDNSNLIAQTLGRYQQFGGDASLAGRVRSLRGQLEGMPGSAPQTPELPTEAVRKALGSKPTEAKVNITQEPTAPEAKTFNPRDWRMNELLKTRENWSRARAYDASPWSLTGGRTALMRGSAALLDRPGFREWLAGPERMKRQAAPTQVPPTGGGGAPSAASPPTAAPPPSTPPAPPTAGPPAPGPTSVPPWAIGPLLKAMREGAQRQEFENLVKRLGGQGKVGPL
jgi:hypothetical protein